jgi:hypothetical protein
MLTGEITKGTGLMSSAIGGHNAGIMQRSQYNYQAAQMANSATIAEQMQKNATIRGAVAQLEQRDRVSRVEGAGRAAYGASGVVIGTGSALDWQQDLQVQADYDRRKIQYNADMEAWGFGIQAENDRAAADNFEIAGGNAYRAGRDNAVFSLMSFLTNGPLMSGLKGAPLAAQAMNQNSFGQNPTGDYDYAQGAKWEAKSWYDTTGGSYTGSYSGPGTTMQS